MISSAQIYVHSLAYECVCLYKHISHAHNAVEAQASAPTDDDIYTIRKYRPHLWGYENAKMQFPNRVGLSFSVDDRKVPAQLTLLACY
jgi:hypothetical protein